MSKTKRVAIYTRVSTDGQSVERQRQELLDVAERRGWTVTEFSDRGISGSKGRDKRPGFDLMLKAVTRGEIDIVAGWSVDRLSRSPQDLIAFLNEVHAANADVYLHQQGLDTSTPTGRAMFQMLGIFAELERAIITERINSGIARAKKHGTRTGNAFGRPPIDAKLEAAVRRAIATGKGNHKIGREVGVGSGTVARIRAEMG